MNRRISGAFSTSVVVVGAAFLLFAPLARAADETPGRPLPTRPGAFSLKLEAGFAIPLTDPQARLFDVGGGQTVKAFWALNRHLDLGPSVTFLALPAAGTPSSAGTAWTYGASLRVKRPHDVPDDDKAFALSPWLDADLLYVRTGGLNRPGFALAAGVAVPIGKARVFWLGPFVRYLHILQGDRAGFDTHDAKIMSIGLSLEVGTGIEREREREPAPMTPAVAEVRTVVKETVSCPDRDQDGIPDAIDHCPDVAGPMDFWGCPAYKKVVVGKDKLELKEKLFFAWNQAVLQNVSFPVLDEVVQALKDNKSFRVQVEGHTSSEGGDEHNQTLSERRATAVRDYLVAHGIEKERLVSKGFASSVPTASNSTVEGRESNRRVDFVVQFNILNDGSK